MRGKLGSAVKKALRPKISVLDPRFMRMRGASRIGDEVYTSSLDSNLHFYIALQFHLTLDWFTLECAWSTKDVFPFEVVWTGPVSRREADAARFRIGELWTTPPGDVWWEFAPRPPLTATAEELIAPPPAIEELLPKVEPLVTDAVGRVRSHVLPYFLKILDGA